MPINQQLVIAQFSDNIDVATQFVQSKTLALADNQILVKHQFVGINALYDRELYRGNVPYIKIDFPYVFGVESVGTVVEVGRQVENFKVGDAVSSNKVGAAYQTYQISDGSNLVSIPEATKTYLTLNPTGISGWLALQNLAELKAGQTVVISAAAGGLGHILVQLCKQKGCKVVAICGSEKKVKLLESLNCCDNIINYRASSLDEILDNQYANKIDVAIDSVGRAMFDRFLRNLAPLGRLIVIGAAAELSAGSFEKVNQARVYESIYWKGASVRCFMNHLYKEQHPLARQTLFGLYQKNQLQVKVDPTPFNGIDSIIEASKYLLAGKSCGKVIVEL